MKTKIYVSMILMALFFISSGALLVFALVADSTNDTDAVRTFVVAGIFAMIFGFGYMFKTIKLLK